MWSEASCHVAILSSRWSLVRHVANGTKVWKLEVDQSGEAPWGGEAVILWLMMRHCITSPLLPCCSGTGEGHDTRKHHRKHTRNVCSHQKNMNQCRHCDKQRPSSLCWSRRSPTSFDLQQQLHGKYGGLILHWFHHQSSISRWCRSHDREKIVKCCQYYCRNNKNVLLCIDGNTITFFITVV